MGPVGVRDRLRVGEALAVRVPLGVGEGLSLGSGVEEGDWVRVGVGLRADPLPSLTRAPAATSSKGWVQIGWVER